MNISIVVVFHHFLFISAVIVATGFTLLAIGSIGGFLELLLLFNLVSFTFVYVKLVVFIQFPFCSV